MSAPTPDRAAALQQLEHFVASAGRAYAKLRNFDLGQDQHVHVSRLSPYLRHRLLLEEEVLHAVLDRHSPSAADKFVQEVFWRTYFKGWLEQHPSVWSEYRAAVNALSDRLLSDNDLSESYRRAIEGNTGIECFDHWVHELIQTGYLHNHARMWFASIWAFTLKLPWQLGADFFYRHLLDGDPASNTLGWRWVCGLHTKGKTYLARAANIAKFTNGRFNPEEQLAARAEALREKFDAARVGLPDLAPPCLNEPYALLVTVEDCHPESLPLSAPPAAIVGVSYADDRSPLPASPAVRAFSSGAVCDALDRASKKFGKPVKMLEGPDWSEALGAWAREANLSAIATTFAPVGPVAEALARARPRLNRQRIDLIQMTRDFDRRAWPNTAGGFFKLKNQVPKLVDSLLRS